MGYTTSFIGQIGYNVTLSNQLLQDLSNMENNDVRVWEKNGFSFPKPAEYMYHCDWSVIPNATGGGHIEWNGAEKFYYYVEWLTYVMSYIMAKQPNVSFNGCLKYQGEETGDVGKIEVKNDIIIHSVLDENFNMKVKYKAKVLPFGALPVGIDSNTSIDSI